MTLNFGLLKQSASFDDGGDLLVSGTEPFKKAKITLTFAGSPQTGTVTPIFDSDETTSLTLQRGVTTGIAKFEFVGKPVFRQVQASFNIAWANSDNIDAFIEGSNNDSDWTELATEIFTAATTRTLFADDVNFRFIRLRMVGGQASHASGVIDVRAVK